MMMVMSLNSFDGGFVKRLVLALMLMSELLVAAAANAGVLVTFAQSGSNVIVTAAGTLTLPSALTPGGTPLYGAIAPSTPEGTLYSSPPAGSNYSYLVCLTPTNTGFGSYASSKIASSATGDIFGFRSANGRVFLPQSFSSGGTINSTVTFPNITVQSLGINPGNTVYTCGSDTITVVAPPTVNSISPTSGSTVGGSGITITGAGFVTGATATVGGVACTSVSVVSSTSITCTTGAHAAGVVDVVVTNPNTQTGTGSGLFTYQYQSPNASGTTPGGSVNATVANGTFTPGSAQFTAAINPPSGQSFPYDIFGFTASTSVGGTITVTLTYPQALAAGTKVWKDLNGTWSDWTNNVTISGNTITYTITDGGAGDADGLVNGRITDPLGPSISSAAVPTLSELAQLMLALMVLSVIGWHFHREGSF
jgi:hypothetical protein